MDNNNFVDDQDKEIKGKKYLIYLLFFTILLFFCVFGITYSIYKPSTDDNGIETGNIIFTYSDVGKVGNGIFIKNATPISDELGKAMIGLNQYFDFSITSSTKNSKIHYKLLIDKDENSTLSNEKVRIYLTQLLVGTENELVLANFESLKIEEINHKKYYVIYDKTLEKNLNDYSDAFRLRLWLKDGATDYDDQFFSIKVDVYAYQVEG